ncbi:MAG: hypothetical protein POELPBGB_01310 [Bacteroidia bacterium]|nr:hypothetical protein [Bacteroidia bacterium]
MTKKPIAVYARVSTAKQEEEKTIQNQFEACKEFAEKNNYEIVTKYTDEGWSGDMLARPALDNLRQDLKTKFWEAVLIYDPDRLARRYSYQELVMDEIKEAGKEVLFVTIESPKNSEDKILHGVRGLFAEYERAKIKERFRLGRMRKLKEGHIIIARPLYGYSYTPKKDNVHGFYTINEEEANVVRMVFNASAEGLSIKKIIRMLLAMSIKPQRSIRGAWSTSTISRMLRHRGYVGEAHYGSTYGVEPQKPTSNQKYRKVKKSCRRLKPRDEWFIIPIPPIIDILLFTKVQEKLKYNREFSNRNRKNEYLLTGKVFCSCGSKRYGESSQRKTNSLYYRCSNRHDRFPFNKTCTENCISASNIDNQIWNKLKELLTSPALIQEQINRWQKEKIDKMQFSNTDVEALKKEISKLEKEKERYTIAYGEGILTMEKLREYTENIKIRTSNIQDQISKSEEVTSNLQSTFMNEGTIEQFSKEVLKTINNPDFEFKRVVVRMVIDKVIGSDSGIHVSGHIPLNTLQNFCNNYVIKEDDLTENFVSEPYTMYSYCRTDGIPVKKTVSPLKLSSKHKEVGNSIQQSVGLSSKDCEDGSAIMSTLSSNHKDKWNTISQVKIPFQFTIYLT